MYIRYIIILLFLNCSFLDDNRRISSGYTPANNGNFIVRVEYDDIQLPNVQIQVSEFPPSLYLTSSYVPSVFFLLPLKSSGYLFPTVQKNLKLELKTDLHTNTDYSFYLPEGKYYMNITNHSDSVTDFPVFLKKNVSRTLNLSFGFKVNHETEYDYTVESYSGRCFQWNRSSDELNFLNADSGTWCPAVTIAEGKKTFLKIKLEKQSIDWPASAFLWIPGIFFLAPLYYGTSVYKNDFTAEMQFR